MSWLSFWTVFLVASLGAFALLVVVVAIRGFGDLGAMLRTIERRERE